MEGCFLTSLPTAVPYMRKKPVVDMPLNEKMRLNKSQPIFPIQEPLSFPVKPPPSSSARSRPKQLCSKPILDDLTLLYLEDISNNIPVNLEDCQQVKHTLQEMLNFHLSRFQYQEATLFSKAIIQMDAEIFRLENEPQFKQTVDSNSTTERVVCKFISEWDTKYIKYLDFCKKENQRLQKHHQSETEQLDASPRPNTSSPRFSRTHRSTRQNRPNSLNITQPSDLTDILNQDSPIKKNNKHIIEKRDSLNESQHVEISEFVKFSNESRIMMVQTRKRVVSDYFNSFHHESQTAGLIY